MKIIIPFDVNDYIFVSRSIVTEDNRSFMQRVQDKNLNKVLKIYEYVKIHVRHITIHRSSMYASLTGIKIDGVSDYHRIITIDTNLSDLVIGRTYKEYKKNIKQSIKRTGFKAKFIKVK